MCHWLVKEDDDADDHRNRMLFLYSREYLWKEIKLITFKLLKEESLILEKEC